jgi:hypothetical protein
MMELRPSAVIPTGGEAVKVARSTPFSAVKFVTAGAVVPKIEVAAVAVADGVPTRVPRAIAETR